MINRIDAKEAHVQSALERKRGEKKDDLSYMEVRWILEEFLYKLANKLSDGTRLFPDIAMSRTVVLIQGEKHYTLTVTSDSKVSGPEEAEIKLTLTGALGASETVEVHPAAWFFCHEMLADVIEKQVHDLKEVVLLLGSGDFREVEG